MTDTQRLVHTLAGLALIPLLGACAAAAEPPAPETPPVVADDPKPPEDPKPAEEPSHCHERTAVLPIATVPQENDACPLAVQVSPYEDLYGRRVRATGNATTKVELDRAATRAANAEEGADLCCYEVKVFKKTGGKGGRGRPYVDAGEAILAPAIGSSTWLGDATPALPEDPRARAELARVWLEDALFEHASVASFARAALELMAHGAPPELIRACLEAASEELVYAQLTFGLASAYAGEPLGPGPLPALSPRGGDLVDLAMRTLYDAAIPETVAALEAIRALEGCEDPVVREVLARIADEESRHAALGWRILRWTIEAGGEAVRQALRSMAIPSSAPSEAPSGLAAFGRLDRTAVARCYDDAVRDVVLPLLASCFEAHV